MIRALDEEPILIRSCSLVLNLSHNPPQLLNTPQFLSTSHSHLPHTDSSSPIYISTSITLVQRKTTNHKKYFSLLISV